jgi:alpha-tubulin suppressor-like RCC1 family protein
MGAVRISVAFGLAMAGLGSTLALLSTTAAVAGTVRPASAPVITSFTVTPSPVRAAGGTVTATAKVRSAQTCTFSIKPKVKGLPVTRHCASGTAKVSVKFPANGSVSVRRFTIKLSVSGGGHTVTSSKTITQPPLTLGGVKTLVGQGQNYCALLTSGRVDCWGFNDLGQLGDRRTKNASRPVAVTGVGGKGALTGVASVVSDVFGYGFQYCAVLKSGGVDCWGYNLNGQLGNGTTRNSDRPVAVKGVGGSGLLTGVKQVQPEIYGFCAALSTGAAVCWGLNSSGELGDNSVTGPQACGATDDACSTTPVTVVGTSGSGALGQVVRLVSEGETMCAQLTTGGVDCWGYGPNGQLGGGSLSGSPFPVVVKGTGGAGALTGVTSLTGLDNGTNICARLTSGKVDCWGEDTWGELGNGTTGIFHDSPVPVAVKGVGGHGTLGAVSSVTGVPGLTNCAILSSRGVDCWGFNGDSVLGNPSVSGLTSNVPVKVVSPSGKGTLGGVTSLVTGDNGQGASICALLTSGGVDCWGSTSAGFSQTPKAVPGLGPGKKQLRVRSLASDQNGSTCAVLVTGGVDCWGAGEVGQLGNGTVNGSLVPASVLAPA